MECTQAGPVGRLDSLSNGEKRLKAQSSTECERARIIALYRCFLQSEASKWTRLRFHELSGKACHCHCRIDKACYLNDLIAAGKEETVHHLAADQTLVPKVLGKALAEVGLINEPRLGWERGRVGACLAAMILQWIGRK